MTQRVRVLVLGASGFIGRQVVAALAASDWATPVGARRRPVPAGQSDIVQLDATDGAAVRRAMAGVGGVVNCVAGGGETIVGNARAVFEAAASLPEPPRIVHLSSMAVYGDMTGEVTESAAVGGALSPYGAAKLDAERLAAKGAGIAILRLGIVYGPHSAQWSERIARLLHAHRLGDLGSAGDGCSNLLYVGDAVAAILQSLRMPLEGSRIINLAGPAFPTWNEYFSRFALALGAVPVARISARRLKIEGKILAPPLKIAEIIAGKLAPGIVPKLPAPIPPSLVRLFAQDIRLNTEIATRDLDIDWTPLEEGLQRAAAAFSA